MKPTPRRLALGLAAAFAAGGAAPARAQFAVTQTFSAQENVPDAGELLSVGRFTVGEAAIARVGVSLKIDGTPAGAGFNGDLYASLIHVSGFSVLLNRPGKNTLTGLGYSDSGLDVVLQDDAPDIHQYRRTLFGNDLSPLGGALTGVWSPDGRTTDPSRVIGSDSRTELLSSFSGLNAVGDWLLFVADLVSGGTHRLDRWGLEVETVGGFTGPVRLVDGTLRALGGPRTIPNPTHFEGVVGLLGTDALTFTGETTLHGSTTLRVENDTTIAGPLISHDPGAGLTKTGAGRLTLAGPATYTGGTVAEEGSLHLENLDGSATGTGTLSVRSGASFGGHGLAGGPVEIRSGGILAPGRGGPTLRTGPLTWHGGGLYRFEIDAADPTRPAARSLVEVLGSLTLDATPGTPCRIEIASLTPGGIPGRVSDFDPGRNYFWPLAIATDGVDGFAASRFALDPGTHLGSAPGAFAVGLDGGTLGILYTAIPEPGWIGPATGVACLLVAAARRARASLPLPPWFRSTREAGGTPARRKPADAPVATPVRE
jgi:autotransporter-associated beta strand protein